MRDDRCELISGRSRAYRRLGVREVLRLGGRFRFGGVCAGVRDPVVDECKEPVEAVGGQLAERDFWPQAGQVRFHGRAAGCRGRAVPRSAGCGTAGGYAGASGTLS